MPYFTLIFETLVYLKIDYFPFRTKILKKLLTYYSTMTCINRAHYVKNNSCFLSSKTIITPKTISVQENVHFSKDITQKEGKIKMDQFMLILVI